LRKRERNKKMKIKREFSNYHSQWRKENEVAAYSSKVAKLLQEGVVFDFPDGIPAFEDAKKFVIVLQPQNR